LKPGGFFFFDEEPYNQVLKLYLYKGKRIYAKETLDRNQFRRVIDYFFKAPSCNEVDHNIIENHQVSIKRWKKALSIFGEKTISLSTVKSIKTDAYKTNSLNYLIAFLLGGSIGGICQKTGTDNDEKISLDNSMICPECHFTSTEIILVLDHGKLKCPACHRIYPKVDGVTFLFTKDKFGELYPKLIE